MALEPALQRVVNLLKYDHQHPRLNDKIKRVLGKNHSPAVQFKIKQEIARLAKPCRRVLDVRSKMTAVDIDQFEFQDMLHYLDQQSAQELKKEYGRYNNEYTEGVYEHVEQFVSQNKQALVDAQTGLKASIQFTQFAQTIRRQEERMHLASPISIARLSDPEQKIHRDFVPTEDNLENAALAVTSDISQSSLSIRTKQHLKVTDYLAISFDGLAKELLFKQKYVLYQVVKVMLDEGVFRVVLKIQSIRSNQEFADYTKNLIYSHKHKYKVNIDNILESIRSKGHEQYYVATDAAIQLFFDRSQKLQCCLTNPDKAQLLSFFGPTEQSALKALFENAPLLTTAQQQAHCFYFIQRRKLDSGQYQYAAQLADNSPKAKVMFQQICRQPENGVLLKLVVNKCDPNVALQRTSVPDEAQQSYGSQRIHRYSPQLNNLMQKIAYVMSVNPVSLTPEMAGMCEQTDTAEQIEFSQPALSNVAVVSVETQDQRHEDRFLLDTKVMFTYRDKDYKTKSVNISAAGLAIGVGSLSLELGSLLEIHFLEFDDRTAQFKLTHCPYKVVHCDDGIAGIHNRDDSNSDARAFWERLMLAKLDSFKLKGREKEPYGLNRALRNLACANVMDAVAFFNIKQNKPNILTIALPQNKNQQALWADAPKLMQHVFKTWFYAPGVVRPMNELCDQFRSTDIPQQGIAMVAYKAQGHHVDVIHSKLIPASSSQVAQLVNLVKVYQKRGCEIAIYAVTMQRTREEFRRYYTDELNYLNRFAAHKCEALYADVRAVTAMLHFVDVTELMLGSVFS